MAVDSSLRDQLVEAWMTNHRINAYLLGSLDEERARELARGLQKFESKHSPARAELETALAASAEAIAQFLCDVLEGRPKRRGFRKGIFTTLAYLVAHESHHRGSILLTLKQCGHMPPKDVVYGIWGWDQR